MPKNYLLVDACSYCFGAASTTSAVLDQLSYEIGHVVFIGTGSALEFLRQHPRITHVIEANTEHLSELQNHRAKIKNASLILVNTNPVMALFARSLGVPVAYIDILPWLERTLDEKIQTVACLYDNCGGFREIADPVEQLAQVDCYIMQSYFHAFDVDLRIRNPILVPPLLGTVAETQQDPKKILTHDERLLVSMGGLFNPDVSPEPLIRYARIVADISWQIASKNGYKEVWFCGPEILCNYIPQRDQATSLRVFRLSHPDFLNAVAFSKSVAIVPGLTSIYETFASGTPTLLLPPTNYSQVLQVRAVRDCGLAGELIANAWQITDERILIDKSEVDSTRQIADLLDRAAKNGKLKKNLRSCFERLIRTQQKDPLIIQRQEVVNRRGLDGALQAAKEIEKVWQSNCL